MKVGTLPLPVLTLSCPPPPPSPSPHGAAMMKLVWQLITLSCCHLCGGGDTWPVVGHVMNTLLVWIQGRQTSDTETMMELRVTLASLRHVSLSHQCTLFSQHAEKAMKRPLQYRVSRRATKTLVCRVNHQWAALSIRIFAHQTAQRFTLPSSVLVLHQCQNGPTLVVTQ